MHHYEPFHTKIWSDKGFKEKLENPLAKLIFIYLFTNEGLTISGIYELDLEECQLRLKIKHGFSQAFKQLLSSGFVQFDEERSLIWVVNRFRYLSNSPKIIQSAINELRQLNHPFKKSFIERYQEVLNPYLLQLDNVLSSKQAENLLTENSIISLSKIYNKPESVKTFLYRRGLEVSRVDEIVERLFKSIGENSKR